MRVRFLKRLCMMSACAVFTLFVLVKLSLLAYGSAARGAFNDTEAKVHFAKLVGGVKLSLLAYGSAARGAFNDTEAKVHFAKLVGLGGVKLSLLAYGSAARGAFNDTEAKVHFAKLVGGVKLSLLAYGSAARGAFNDTEAKVHFAKLVGGVKLSLLAYGSAARGAFNDTEAKVHFAKLVGLGGVKLSLLAYGSAARGAFNDTEAKVHFAKLVGGVKLSLLAYGSAARGAFNDTEAKVHFAKLVGLGGVKLSLLAYGSAARGAFNDTEAKVHFAKLVGGVKLSLLAYGSAARGAFNDTEAKVHFAKLCDEYKSGHLDGNMCNKLCYNNQYMNLTILNYKKSAGKTVIVVYLGGQKIVFKSEHPDFWKYDHISPSVPYPEFTRALLEHANTQTELGWPPEFKRHLVEALFPGFTGADLNNSVALRRSLWTLAQQDEYITFTILKSGGLFPKIMGSCGHFYAVEYTVPFKMDSYFYGTVRSRILLHIMGTLKLMLGYMNEPLQWCDVKFEHFGLHIDYPKRFLILDGDMVFTQSRLESIFKSLDCSSDKDCKFFDCHATCNTTLKRCNPQRANDNIKVFCQHLIHELYGNFWTRSNKLLEACHLIPKQTSAERIKNVHNALVFGLPDDEFDNHGSQGIISAMSIHETDLGSWSSSQLRKNPDSVDSFLSQLPDNQRRSTVSSTVAYRVATLQLVFMVLVIFVMLCVTLVCCNED